MIHHIGNYKYAPQSCRQLMWHLINIAQEREIKLLSQTHSPEVDYSPFIIMAVLEVLERVEMQPAGTCGLWKIYHIHNCIFMARKWAYSWELVWI